MSVVIATLRRPESLAETLASVLACDPLPAEVIVVDGDPELSARVVVEASGSGILGVVDSYLASPTGLTRQRNLGLDAARHDVVVYLDDDVTVPPHVFAAIADAYRDPQVVGVTGRILGDRSRLVGRESRLRRLLPGGGQEGGFTRYGYPRYVGNVAEPHDVEHMPGCFMSARRELAHEIRFDEELTGYALAEDEDFSRRLARRGRIRYLPGVEVEHRLAPHEPSPGQARALNRTLVVNRAYLFRKNFPQTRLARAQFAGLLVVLAAHRLLRRDLAAVRGIADGTVELARAGRALASAGRVPAEALPVAFVSSHARAGGSERQLEWLLEAIDPEWVRLVVSLEEGRLPDVSRGLGRATIVLPTGNHRTDLLRAAWRLRRVLRRSRPRVVHANGVKAAAVAGLATVGTRIPVVWVKHDFSLDGRVAALIARRCALVVGVSEAVLRTFDGRSEPRRRVVHNGVPEIPVDRDRGRALARAAFGSDPPGTLVALVGRLEADKGHDEVLAIVPALRERIPEVGVLFVGGADLESPYARSLASRVDELGLADVVRFVPHREDARELISGCSVLLHASIPGDGRADTEGFPLVALEAMLAGTPVVGYANGGLAELVADTGRVVSPGDRAALAAAAIELLADAGLRADLGARARKRVRGRFLMPANVLALQQCYRDVLG